MLNNEEIREEFVKGFVAERIKGIAPERMYCGYSDIRVVSRIEGYKRWGEIRSYLSELPSELLRIAETTKSAKLSWDKGMDLKAYDALVTANAVANLLFRNFPLELFVREGEQSEGIHTSNIQ